MFEAGMLSTVAGITKSDDDRKLHHEGKKNAGRNMERVEI